MMYRLIQASLLGLLAAVVGCSSGDDDAATGGTGGTGMGAGATGGVSGTTAGGTGGGSGGTAPAMCATSVTATDTNNYKFQSTLTVEVTKVQPSADIHFDWSAVKKDLLGHDLDLSTIDMVEVSLWNLTLDNFEMKLNDDALGSPDLSIIASILPNPPGTTTGDIYQLTNMGYPYTKDQINPYLDITNYPPDSHLYTVMLANGMVYGKGTRMIAGFQLDASSTNTQVNVTSDSTKLQLSADLHSLTSPAVPAGNPAITIDWTNMTKTSSGLHFEPSYITQVRVGKYSKSVTDLEDPANFLSLDSIADTMYSAPVLSGTTFDLSQTKDPSGAAFPGIDDAHTWIIALNCTDNCTNPAPWYLTVLKTCAQ